MLIPFIFRSLCVHDHISARIKGLICSLGRRKRKWRKLDNDRNSKNSDFLPSSVIPRLTLGVFAHSRLSSFSFAPDTQTLGNFHPTYGQNKVSSYRAFYLHCQYLVSVFCSRALTPLFCFKTCMHSSQHRDHGD